MGAISFSLDRAVGYPSGRKGNGRVLEVMPLGFRAYYRLLAGVEDYFNGKSQDAFEIYIKTGGYAAYLNKRIGKSDGYEIDVVVPDMRVEVKPGKAGGRYQGMVLCLGK